MCAARKFALENDYGSENGDVVIYARYSSHGQTEQSIEGQLRYCYEYAERRGFRVVGEYIDRALSGTKAETRPEFLRMIKDSRKKQFSYVLVWKLDRFARNRYDSAIYKNELKKNGVKVLSVTESVGDGDESIILEAVLEAMAETYSRQLSSNVRRGLKESALKGNSTGGSVPLGYKIEGKKLVIDEETAPIVRFVYEQYAAGVGRKEIADELNARGYRTRQGKLFNLNSFFKILGNKKYIGVFHYDTRDSGEGGDGVIEVEGGCPALVDKELFDKCEKKAKITKRAPGHNKALVEYLLQGKIFCGYCGSPMVAESGRSARGPVYNYYACAARKKHHTCKKKNEKKDFLEWYIVEQVVEYVLSPSRIDFIAERVVQEYNKEFNDDAIKELERRLSKIDREINETVDALIKTSSKVAIDKINEKLALLETQKADADIDLVKLRIANKARITEDEIKAFLRQFCKGDLFDMNFRRRIIDVFINAIYLYDDKVVMYFNIKDGEQISYIDMLDSSEEPIDGAEMVRICDVMAHHVGASLPLAPTFFVKLHLPFFHPTEKAGSPHVGDPFLRFGTDRHHRLCCIRCDGRPEKGHGYLWRRHPRSVYRRRRRRDPGPGPGDHAPGHLSGPGLRPDCHRHLHRRLSPRRPEPPGAGEPSVRRGHAADGLHRTGRIHRGRRSERLQRIQLLQHLPAGLRGRDHRRGRRRAP